MGPGERWSRVNSLERGRHKQGVFTEKLLKDDKALGSSGIGIVLLEEFGGCGGQCGVCINEDACHLCGNGLVPYSSCLDPPLLDGIYGCCCIPGGLAQTGRMKHNGCQTQCSMLNAHKQSSRVGVGYYACAISECDLSLVHGTEERQCSAEPQFTA